MKGSTHVYFGVGLGIGLTYITGSPSIPFLSYPSYTAGLLVGSLFPDIDHSQSYLGRRLPFFSVPIHRIFGHRGITHSLLFIGILGIATAYWWINYPYLITGFLIGNLTHLLGDMCTPSGIPLLYPKKKRYGFRRKKA